MGAQHSGNETTVDVHVARDQAPARSLLVICDDQVKTFDLPEQGVLLIGRAPEAEIRIDSPSISRRHAEVHVDERISIKDLGSRNGTRLRAGPLAPDEMGTVELGEPFEVGSAKCVLQRRLTFARLARLWTHEAFETRLEKACAAGGGSGTELALIRLRVRAKTDPSDIQVKILAALAPKDIVARSGPYEYEVIAQGASPERAEQVLAELLAKLGSDADRAGLACFPRDGKTPLELQSKAWDALARHRPGPAGTPGAPREEAAPASTRLDDAMRSVMLLVAKVGMSPLNALLMGETGVGKEVIAERIHASSPRRDKPLVKLNCAALSETLLESELFGHERGAFTGAMQTKKGLLETAAGGTVMLDEVGELPLGMQAKLLRVVEERRVLRVGGLESRPIDVRFLAATNRDLEKESETGAFRQDLYFRLCGVTVHIPPLRERVSEIEPLARMFAAEGDPERGAPDFSEEALELLRRYTWPGNIRELRNVVLRAVMLSDGGRILSEHLPVEKMCARMAPVSAPQIGAAGQPPSADLANPASPAGTLAPWMPSAVAPTAFPPAAPTVTSLASAAAGGAAPFDPTSGGGAMMPPLVPPPPAPTTLRTGVEDYEKARVIEALEQAKGNQTQAAKLLGISRGTLVSRIEQFDLPRPRKGKS
jgi:two-component system response regulator AtoC